MEISDRLVQGGHFVLNKTPPVNSSVENNDGKHSIGWETGSPFFTDAGIWTMVWSHDGGTPHVIIYGSAHATKAGQIEPQGSFKFVGTNITSGLDPGHLHTQGGVIGGRSGVLSVGYVKPGIVRWSKGSGEGTQTLRALYARVGVAPSGGNLVVEVRKVTTGILDSVDAYTDAAAATLLGTLTITTGNFAASSTGLSAVIADGDLIVLKVTTVTGSPAELVVNAVIEG